MRTGFAANLVKLRSQHICPYVPPVECPVNPSLLTPRLLHGETAQGFWTVSYIAQTIRSGGLDQHPRTKVYLKQLL
jgi:hypothetical protein